jgi:hypothetical protein
MDCCTNRSDGRVSLAAPRRGRALSLSLSLSLSLLGAPLGRRFFLPRRALSVLWPSTDDEDDGDDGDDASVGSSGGSSSSRRRPSRGRGLTDSKLIPPKHRWVSSLVSFVSQGILPQHSQSAGYPQGTCCCRSTDARAAVDDAMLHGRENMPVQSFLRCRRPPTRQCRHRDPASSRKGTGQRRDEGRSLSHTAAVVNHHPHNAAPFILIYYGGAELPPPCPLPCTSSSLPLALDATARRDNNHTGARRRCGCG